MISTTVVSGLGDSPRRNRQQAFQSARRRPTRKASRRISRRLAPCRLLARLAGWIIEPAGLAGRDGWHGVVAADFDVARRAAVLHPLRLDAKAIDIESRLLD